MQQGKNQTCVNSEEVNDDLLNNLRVEQEDIQKRLESISSEQANTLDNSKTLTNQIESLSSDVFDMENKKVNESKFASLSSFSSAYWYVDFPEQRRQIGHILSVMGKYCHCKDVEKSAHNQYERMAQCTRCKCWYHERCVGASMRQILGYEDFTCQLCILD